MEVGVQFSAFKFDLIKFQIPVHEYFHPYFQSTTEHTVSFNKDICAYSEC